MLYRFLLISSITGSYTELLLPESDRLVARQTISIECICSTAWRISVVVLEGYYSTEFPTEVENDVSLGANLAGVFTAAKGVVVSVDLFI